MTKRVCRVCNRAEDNACQTPEGPCTWIMKDLCSSCCIEVPASPNEKNFKSWLVEKTCRFCAHLVAGLPYKGKTTWTCDLGRFDGMVIPHPGHQWFAWSGIWRPNKTVKASQMKCPHFAMFDRFYEVNKEGRCQQAES